VPLTVQVYLVQGERLARVTRTVPPGAGLEPSFVGLATPITRTQSDAGYRSALPVASTPLHGTVVDGVARVDLPSGFERISVHEQALAMAQLVFTVTANSLATSVQLVQDGRALPVPAPGGQLVTRPVTRVDYAAYDPASCPGHAPGVPRTGAATRRGGRLSRSAAPAGRGPRGRGP
jgi:hypothetical protein